MPGTTFTLLLAVTAFVSLHFILSHRPVRDLLIARLGENGFSIVYSLIAIVTLVWTVAAYRAAPTTLVWSTPGWLAVLVTGAMLPVAVLFVAGLSTPSPTVVRGDTKLQDQSAGRGILAITRNPFLWAVAGWALLHIAANGDVASIILFGGLLVLAVGGAYHIDARRRAKLGLPWMTYAARTSNMPFAAIIEGRAEMPSPSAIGLWRVLAGLAFYAGAVGAHLWADLALGL